MCRSVNPRTMTYSWRQSSPISKEDSRGGLVRTRWDIRAYALAIAAAGQQFGSSQERARLQPDLGRLAP